MIYNQRSRYRACLLSIEVAEVIANERIGPDFERDFPL